MNKYMVHYSNAKTGEEIRLEIEALSFADAVIALRDRVFPKTDVVTLIQDGWRVVNV